MPIILEIISLNSHITIDLLLRNPYSADKKYCVSQRRNLIGLPSYTQILDIIKSILLNIMFFAPMGRFQLELIYLYFPPSPHLLYVCFCPVGLSLL